MQPELDERCTLRAEAALECDDLGVGALPLVFARETLNALDQHAPVIAAVKQAHAALPGDVRPESPEEVVALLTVARRRELGDREMARVERRGQPPDRSALARGI